MIQGFILVRAERPYVQFAAARVTGTWFTVGVTNRRERERILVSCGRSERVLRARLSLSRVLVSCSYIFISWFGLVWISLTGRPAFPFIDQWKARVIEEENEKNEREKKTSRVAGSFSPSCGSR